jgi:hypothetical protein
MANRSIFHELLGLAPGHEDGKKTFHVDSSDMALHVTGYAPSEVVELLTAYREHQEKMIGLVEQITAVTRAMQSESDAVRYVPQGPEDIMGEHTRS